MLAPLVSRARRVGCLHACLFKSGRSSIVTVQLSIVLRHVLENVPVASCSWRARVLFIFVCLLLSFCEAGSAHALGAIGELLNDDTQRFAFVKFFSPRAALSAVQAVDGKWMLYGHLLKVRNWEGDSCCRSSDFTL